MAWFLIPVLKLDAIEIELVILTCCCSHSLYVEWG